MIILDKVAALIIKDKKLLLVRERGKKIFVLPGGKRKLGESDDACLKRELKEELNVDIDEMHRFGKYTDMYGLVNLIAYMCKVYGNARAASEIEEMKWTDMRSALNIHRLTKEAIMVQLAAEGIIS